MSKSFKVSFIVDTNEDCPNANEALKTLEHHADRLLDLDSWREEIKAVHDFKVEEADSL